MAVAPSTARAFTGESTVLNAGKTDLTAPAKSILTNPTFLATDVEEAAAFGGASEASAAARVFQAAKVLPGLGSAVLAFGVGAAVGTEICGVIGIEGCWTFSSDQADPVNETGGHWEFLSSAEQVGFQYNGIYTIPAFTWAWSRDGNSTIDATVYGEENSCFNPAVPVGLSAYVVESPAGYLCKEAAAIPTKIALRYAMENRTLSYTGADDPEVSNYGYTAPSDWSEKLASQLKEQGDSPAGRVGEKIASKIEGSEVKNPYAAYVSIPDCDGLVYATCAKELEEAGLEPQREEIDWSEVTTTTPAEVLELEPAPETEVEVPSKVTVITNPDEAGMPLVIPAPEAGETYDDYAARLNPALEPTQKVVSDANADAELGADAVLATDPSGGSKLPPTGGQVDVYTNPPYMAPGGAAWEPPEVPGIDLSPFEMVTPCEVFPFGAACWFVEAIEDFALVSGKCPTWDMEFLGVLSSEHDEQELGLCAIAPVVEGVRPWVFFVGSIFMVLTFAAIARSGGTPSDQAANSAADRAD